MEINLNIRVVDREGLSDKGVDELREVITDLTNEDIIGLLNGDKFKMNGVEFSRRWDFKNFKK